MEFLTLDLESGKVTVVVPTFPDYKVGPMYSEVLSIYKPRPQFKVIK